MVTTPVGSRRIRHAWAGVAIAVLFWSNWPALRALFDRWMGDPRYSHGFLVPVFAAYLLWYRRQALVSATRATRTGLALITAGAVAQAVGALYYFEWLQQMALIPVLAGVVALWGGLEGLRWAGPSLAFLAFMVPFPYKVEVALSGPLQRIGTLASTYTLQTLGLPAIAEGNVIHVGDYAAIAVVEACNGLGMLAAFACYATAAAILMRDRGIGVRAVIVLGAPVLALMANVARITVTGLAHATLGGRAADLVFHDLSGWLMMPLAIALLWWESALLERLVVPIRPDGPIAFLPAATMSYPRSSRLGRVERP